MDEFAIGDANPEAVMVRGIEGIWIEEVLQGMERSEGERTFFGYNYLLWEENGFLFTIRSASLPQAEMLRIAESLLPADHETLTSTPTPSP